MNRVLFVSMGINIPGGIASLAGSTLAALDAFASEGRLEQVDLVSYLDDSDPARPTPRGRSYHASGSKTRFIGQYIRAVRTGTPDFILFDVIGGARATRLPLPGVRSTPYAVMVHDVIDLDPGTRRHLVPVLRRAARIIANSPTTFDRVSKLVPDRRDATAIVTPPVLASRIALWSRIPHRPLTEREPVVLVAGRLDADQPGKGHDALLRAWPTVLDSVPAARLVVAGDGTNRLKLEDLASSLRLRNSVEFVGFVSDERLGHLFAEASLFAMPSQQEGFGIVYAEAMSHGLPCIGSTADAAKDVIDDGHSGLLVPFGNPEATALAVLRFLENPELSRSFGERGRQIYLDRFTPEAHRAQLASALEIRSH